MVLKATDQESPAHAQGLERAYRMALGLEAAARQRLGDSDPPFIDLTQWLLASELLNVLDELRTGLLRSSLPEEYGRCPDGSALLHPGNPDNGGLAL